MDKINRCLSILSQFLVINFSSYNFCVNFCTDIFGLIKLLMNWLRKYPVEENCHWKKFAIVFVYFWFLLSLGFSRLKTSLKLNFELRFSSYTIYSREWRGTDHTDQFHTLASRWKEKYHRNMKVTHNSLMVG